MKIYKYIFYIYTQWEIIKLTNINLDITGFTVLANNVLHA